MPLRAVIFDVDGTLAETEEGHRAAFNRSFAEAGLDWLWDQSLYAHLLRVTGGKERMQAYHASMPAGTPAPDFAALHRRKNEIYATLAPALPLRPGIAKLIEALQADGLPLAIATTTSPENVESLLDGRFSAGWRTVFPVVVAGAMVPRKKPDPAVYHAALDALGCRAAEAIAIEDSGPGIAAARAASVAVVVTPSLYFADDPAEEANLVVPDARALTPALLARIVDGVQGGG